MDYSFIPSKTVREYSEQNNITYSDFEKAAFIYHYTPTMKERNEKLLLLITTDEVLQNQIKERMVFDVDCVETFKKASKDYIYIVRLVEYYVSKDTPTYILDYPKRYGYDGYFSDYASAYAFALKNCKNQEFVIEKQAIASKDKIPTRKYYCNPYLETVQKGEWIGEIEEYGSPISSCYYNGDGEFLKIESDEVEQEEKFLLDLYFNTSRFENAYIDIKHPFKRGDIIKHGNELGIVTSTASKALHAFKDQLCFYDACLFVDLIDGKGFYSSTAGIAELELYKLNKNDRVANLLSTGRELLNGIASLTEFLESYEDFKAERK
ncbi:MAG: hypothetical protein K2G88_00460 [Oscillospiraceae bacterium]|nr:hypothetical protein [Oscillospiraceae bacterium]